MTKTRRVLVLGVTGFIGRNCAEALCKRPDLEVYGTYHRSHPFDHPKIRMIQADLTKKDDVHRVLQGADVIIQAAAVTSGAADIVAKPYIHTTDNAVMNSFVFRAAHELDVKHLIFFSCSILYNSSDQPVKESDFDSTKIHSKYFSAGWTKLYLEKMAEFYSSLGKTRYTILRHSNIYGPYDKFDLNRSHVFGATVTKVMNPSDTKVTVWGDGSEERDLLYVSDLINYIELAIDRQNGPFSLNNVGLGQSVSVLDLVRKMIAISGQELEIVFDHAKPSIKTKLCLDISRAKQEFGWVPRVSLDDGIRKTLDWYKRNKL